MMTSQERQPTRHAELRSAAGLSYTDLVQNRLQGFVHFTRTAMATRDVKIAVFLWLMTFVTCYLRFTQFGLYEDDLNQARFWAYTPGEMLDYLIYIFESGGGGRPIGLTFLRGGFMGGYNLGGLDALYMIGIFVFVSNAFLTYKITESIAPPVIALAAGLMFVLFPADALKFTVVRSFAVQPALTFGLGGILFYIHRRYIAAYLCAVLALATYEFGLLPFLLAPFFILEDFRSKVIRVAKHALVTGSILGTILFLRLTSQATGRLDDVVDLTWADRLDRLFTALYVGPWTSLQAFWIKPKAFFADFEAWHLIVFIFVALSSYLGLRFMSKAPDLTVNRAVSLRGVEAARGHFLDRLFSEKNVTLLLLIGGAAWIVAYAMAITDSRFPPTKQFGRTTSVHTAATVGASMTFAAVVWALALLSKRFRFEPNFTAWPLVAAYLAILGGFQAVIQSKVIESWATQRLIWTQIDAQIDDWQDGTVVIVGYDRAPHTKYVYTMSWGTTVTASNMFEFPSRWEEPPTTLFTPQLKTSYGLIKDGDFYVKRLPWKEHTIVDPTKIIYFEVQPGNVLKRSFGEFRYLNYKTKLAPKGPAQKLKKKPLYDVLILPPGTLNNSNKDK